jgi:hypothetical protein
MQKMVNIEDDRRKDSSLAWVRRFWCPLQETRSERHKGDETKPLAQSASGFVSF